MTGNSFEESKEKKWLLHSCMMLNDTAEVVSSHVYITIPQARVVNTYKHTHTHTHIYPYIYIYIYIYIYVYIWVYEGFNEDVLPGIEALCD